MGGFCVSERGKHVLRSPVMGQFRKGGGSSSAETCFCFDFFVPWTYRCACGDVFCMVDCKK